MKLQISICCAVFNILLLEGCSSDDVRPDPLIRAYVSSSIFKGDSIGPVRLQFLYISYSTMSYHSTTNQQDSTVCRSSSLNGPNLIELFSDFYGYKMDSTRVPSGAYNRLTFELALGRSNAIGYMWKKSIRISGYIRKTRFEYWYDREFNVNTYLPDSLLTVMKGKPVDLLIYFDLHKAFDPRFDGIDISKAADGDHNGDIYIERSDPDNGSMVDPIFAAIMRNISIRRK